MKELRFLAIGIFVGIFLVFGLLMIGSLRSALAQDEQPANPGTPLPFSDEGRLILTQSAPDGSDEIASFDQRSNPQGPNVLPTQIPGETLVYFFTTDNDGTATVLNLLNTDSVAHTVALRGYNYAGVLGNSWNIIVPATSIVRLASDSIVAAPPSSWATPQPIVTNFTDFTYFASLSLPKGVKVEGYTLVNAGTGFVDPRADQGAVPLRFSTDPNTVFLPALNSP